MVASTSDTPLAKKREEEEEEEGDTKHRLVFLLSPETVNHHSAAAAFTQVDANSRLPHVKYRLVWQVVKVPLAHAHLSRSAQTTC